jgi:hypothetical protein
LEKEFSYGKESKIGTGGAYRVSITVGVCICGMQNNGRG